MITEQKRHFVAIVATLIYRRTERNMELFIVKQITENEFAQSFSDILMIKALSSLSCYPSKTVHALTYILYHFSEEKQCLFYGAGILLLDLIIINCTMGNVWRIAVAVEYKNRTRKSLKFSKRVCSQLLGQFLRKLKYVWVNTFSKETFPFLGILIIFRYY